MNRRLILVFAFALVVAGCATFAVYRLIVAQVGKFPAQQHTAAPLKMVVASRDLQVGTLIHDEDLSEVAWSGPIPETVVKTRAEIIGRGVIANIYQKEPISDKRLAAKGAGAGLASTIPVGMRAVALRVNEVVGLAGFVLPGMRVDVLITGVAPGNDASRTGTMCRTVLQNLEVLSAGQKIEKNVDGKPESVQVVNLLVSPQQAEILDLASDERVQLVLRNPLDTNQDPTPGVSLANLFGQSVGSSIAARPVVARVLAPHITPAPSLMTVEVFSGAKRTEQHVEMLGKPE